MATDPFEIKIHNLVYTCFINTKINLDHVARKFSEMGIAFDYNPKKFAAVFLRSITSIPVPVPKEYAHSDTIREYRYYMRKRSQKNKGIGNVAVLLFSGKKSDEGGKMVCTGVKLAAQARFILERIEVILKQIGYNASIIKYELQNLVATHSVNSEIDIRDLANANSTFCTYDNERFPGAIMRHPDLGRVTILVFKSGNLVITGAKHEDKVRHALVKVYPILSQFIDTPAVSEIATYSGISSDYSGIEKEAINELLEEFIVKEYTD